MERKFVNGLDRVGQSGHGGGAIALGAMASYGPNVALAQENEPCNVVGTCTSSVNGYFRPARTTDGWTIVPQEDCDTRIVYVADAANGGSDSNNGTSPQTPFATMVRAYHQIRLWNGNPDKTADARIRVLRGSVFDGQTLNPNTGADGKFGGKGPDDPFVIQAWYNPNLPGTEFQQPRPIFKLPVDNDPNSPDYGNMVSPGLQFTGGATCPTQDDWGGDFWVIGLELTSQEVEYGGDFYPPLGTQSAFLLADVKSGRYLIEDCYVHDMGSFANFNGSSTDLTAGITVRRNVIARTWTRAWAKYEGTNDIWYDAPMDMHRRESRGGGMYTAHARWTLVEENFWSQCGWSHKSNDLVAAIMRYNPLSPKSVYSQTMYFTPTSEHMLIRSNVVSEPAHAAIQSRGNFHRIEDNLILEAPMGISMGHAENQPSSGPIIPERYWRGSTSNNVILNGENLDVWLTQAGGTLGGFILNDDARGNGMTLSRCRRFSGNDGSGAAWSYFEDGQQFEAATVFNNLVAHNETGKSDFGAGLFSDDDRGNTSPSIILTYSARVYNNVVYNWKGAGSNGAMGVYIANTQTESGPNAGAAPLGPNFEFTNNTWYQADKVRVGRARWNPVGGFWHANLYYSAQLNPQQRYQVKPGLLPLSDPPAAAPFTASSGPSWRVATGETTTAELTGLPSTIPDPNRKLKDYMIYAGLPTASATSQKDAARQYMSLCEQLRRGNWNVALLAANANDYIRRGYGL